MSGYEVPYPPPPIGYNLPLPVPIEPNWRPAPPPSTEHALQQPFDQWSRPNLGMPLPPPYPSAHSYDANGMVRPGPGGVPIQQQQQQQQQGFPIPNLQSGWGLPRGGVIHVPPGIPDEMLPRQFAPGAELVKVTGKVSFWLSHFFCNFWLIIPLSMLVHSLVRIVGQGKSR